MAGWLEILGRAAYADIMVVARKGDPVLIDGYPSVITHVEFDAVENRGRYKAKQINPLPPGGVVHVLDHEWRGPMGTETTAPPDDTAPSINHVRDAVEANR